MLSVNVSFAVERVFDAVQAYSSSSSVSWREQRSSVDLTNDTCLVSITASLRRSGSLSVWLFLVQETMGRGSPYPTQDKATVPPTYRLVSPGATAIFAGTENKKEKHNKFQWSICIPSQQPSRERAVVTVVSET